MRIGEVLTMAEYINRKAAIRALLNDAPEQVGYSREDATDCIRYMDADDVSPVRHGCWERVIPSKSAAKWSTKVSCSNCHGVGYMRYNYCPNCAAKMDKEE